MGLFGRIRERLSRTKQQIVDRFDDIVRRADEPGQRTRPVDVDTVEALEENMKALLDAVNKSRPTGIKGVYLKKVSVSSTMGVGVRIDQSSLAG